MDKPAHDHHGRSGVEVREVFPSFCLFTSCASTKITIPWVLRGNRARENMEVLDHKRAVERDKGLIPKETNNRGKDCSKGDRGRMLKKAFLPPQC